VDPARPLMTTFEPAGNSGVSAMVTAAAELPTATGLPSTFRLVKLVPAVENRDALPLASVDATARTASAVPPPLSRFRPTASATLVCSAPVLGATREIELDRRIVDCRTGASEGLGAWLVAEFTPGPVCALDTGEKFRLVPIPSNENCTFAAR